MVDGTERVEDKVGSKERREGVVYDEDLEPARREVSGCLSKQFLRGGNDNA